MTDHVVASEIATEAGRLLLTVREALTRQGADMATVKDEGDRRSHDFIVDALRRQRPDDAVLSEEGRDDAARLTAARVWIVDPVDGTREYAEGRTDWAVHVALWEDGGLVAGAVALPGLSTTLSTAEPPAIAASNGGAPRLAVSRTRPPAVTDALVEALDAELVAMGSAGAKAMAVVRGEADVYAHAGGQYEWDSAAPVAVAAAAGLHTSRLDGSPLRYNQPDSYLPDLLICRPEHADAVLAAAAAFAKDEVPKP